MRTMTEPAPPDDDNLDFDFPPVTLQDRLGWIIDDLDTAADELTEDDLEKLCAAVRKKVDDIDPALPF
jgi:hypothetical protein